MMKNKIKIAFFGTSEFSVMILQELRDGGFIPSLIITAPDKPKGRKLILTPTPVKIWAQENSVRFLQPQRPADIIEHLKKSDLFITASYGALLPFEILKLPKYGALNVHPSLLPKYRGPSPIQSAILAGDKETGVTIMLMDEEMDHGPVVAQARIEIGELLKYSDLEKLLAREGGQMLAETIPKWIDGKIAPEKQDHGRATIAKIIKKEDGLIELDDDQAGIYRKFLAFEKWPGIYFFAERRSKSASRSIRVKITEADFENGVFKIKKVIPEGKKEMDYDDFLRG